MPLEGPRLYTDEKLFIDEAEKMLTGEESLRILCVLLEYIEIFWGLRDLLCTYNYFKSFFIWYSVQSVWVGSWGFIMIIHFLFGSPSHRHYRKKWYLD